MKTPEEARTVLANRHIAKLLDRLERYDQRLSEPAKKAVRNEMHWLVEDIETGLKYGYYDCEGGGR